MTTERFVPANHPAGVRTEVKTSGGVFEGELVEIREGGLIVLSNEAGQDAPPGTPPQQLLRLIPFQSIVHARFDQHRSGYDIIEGRGPSSRVRERLRLLSRFPYGMSPEVEAALLKLHGQTAFAGVER
jgi:hypothetical protein